MGKIARTTPSSSSKLEYSCKKVKVELKSNNLKGSFSKPARFACLLYVEVPQIGDGNPISCKELAEIYELSTESMSPKKIRIPINLTTKKFQIFLVQYITRMVIVMCIMKILS